MTREEIIDFCEMKSQLEPENEDIFNYIIKALEQEPNKEAYNQGFEDCRQATIEAFQMFREYEANRTNAEWIDRIETVVKKLPPINPQEPKTDNDLDMKLKLMEANINGYTQGLKDASNTEQEPKYCDRNICVSNEYNGISCDECEVTKSQEPQESEEKNEHYIPIQSLCGDINDIIDES